WWELNGTMRSLPTSRIAAALVVAALLITAWIFFERRQEGDHKANSPSDSTDSLPSPPKSPSGGNSANSGKALTFTPPSIESAADTTVPPDDREIGVRLHEWLTSSPDIDAVSFTIAKAFRTVRKEDQAEVARELIPLVRDEHFDTRLRPLLLDSTLSPDALAQFFRTMTLRTDEIELPLLIEIAKQGDTHPCYDDAIVRLSIRFGGDLNSPWETWQPLVEAELKRKRELLGN
ncbi:MAG: hypothetical protein KDL87_18190, partial [Verrucomicrobiae bacterium]|nr:hypothetical protein [Verrucomicrobiae bacterium]